MNDVIRRGREGVLPLVGCWFNFQIVNSLLINLHILLRYPTPIFYFLMGPQCVHKHYIPPFSGIYVVVIGKKGGKLRRQILQPSQAIDFQSILIYVYIWFHNKLFLYMKRNISLGEYHINDLFYPVEFQQRGSAYIHYLFWLVTKQGWVPPKIYLK